jgi:hypothetical protein
MSVIGGMTLASFTCVKCKRTLRGKPSMHIMAPGIIGFENVHLCRKCCSENVAFLQNQMNSLVKGLDEGIQGYIDEHGINEHADALRVELELTRNYIKRMTMYYGNNAIKKESEKLGCEILDELHLNYQIEQPIKVPDSYDRPRTYRVDVYIEPKLALEFDGRIHDKLEGVKAHDKIKDYHLRQAGFIVLRFGMNDLQERKSDVKSRILDAYNSMFL